MAEKKGLDANKGKAKKNFEGARAKEPGPPPPSKLELEKLRQKRHDPRPEMKPKGPGGAAQESNDRAAFQQRQRELKAAEERKRLIKERLDAQKGRAKKDFDRSR